MTTDTVVAQLAGRSPRRLLEDLAVLGRALSSAERPRPEIEIHLNGGGLLRGRIVDLADAPGGAVATVLIGGTASAPTVSFVRVDQIAAVTVIDASLLVRPPVQDAPTPGRLELSKQVTMHGAALATALGRTVPILLPGELDDDARRAAAATLPLLVEVLIGIASEPEGKRALAGIEAIELSAGSAGEVALPDPRRLVVQAPRLFTEQFTAHTLRSAIEKVL